MRGYLDGQGLSAGSHVRSPPAPAVADQHGCQPARSPPARGARRRSGQPGPASGAAAVVGESVGPVVCQPTASAGPSAVADLQLILFAGRASGTRCSRWTGTSRSPERGSCASAWVAASTRSRNSAARSAGLRRDRLLYAVFGPFSWAGDGLGRCHGDFVAHGCLSVARPAVLAPVGSTVRATVGSLVDRVYPSGVYDARHPRVHRQVDDRALRAADRGELGRARGSFERQIEDRDARWVVDRAKLRRCRHAASVGEIIIRIQLLLDLAGSF